MRKTNQANGLTVAAYAGSTGVQLAWDLDEAKRADLLGFGIRRYRGSQQDRRRPAGRHHVPRPGP